eukprot:1767724-Pleurochrysis_carterae.AAC.2
MARSRAKQHSFLLNLSTLSISSWSRTTRVLAVAHQSPLQVDKALPNATCHSSVTHREDAAYDLAR